MAVNDKLPDTAVRELIKDIGQGLRRGYPDQPSGRRELSEIVKRDPVELISRLLYNPYSSRACPQALGRGGKLQLIALIRRGRADNDDSKRLLRDSRLLRPGRRSSLFNDHHAPERRRIHVGNHAGGGKGTRPVLERALDRAIRPEPGSELDYTVGPVTREVPVECRRPFPAREAVNPQPAAWLEPAELGLLTRLKLVAVHLEHESRAAGTRVARSAIRLGRSEHARSAGPLHTHRRRADVWYRPTAHRRLGCVVGFLLPGIARGAHGELLLRAGLSAPLLDDMRKLVGQQTDAARPIRLVLTSRERDIAPHSECIGAKCRSRLRGGAVDVDTYIGETMAED